MLHTGPLQLKRFLLSPCRYQDALCLVPEHELRTASSTGMEIIMLACIEEANPSSLYSLTATHNYIAQIKNDRHDHIF